MMAENLKDEREDFEVGGSERRATENCIILCYEDCESTKYGTIRYQRGRIPFEPNIISYKWNIVLYR